MPATVRRTTDLDAPLAAVWDAMRRPSTFLFLVRGLFSVPKLRGRTEHFVAGESDAGWLFAFHVVPVYRHHITVVDVDAATHTIRTHEHGGALRTWNHTLHAETLAGGRCRYTDTVEIDAGVLTPVAKRIAQAIFRYRHHRWALLARRLAAVEGPGRAHTA